MNKEGTTDDLSKIVADIREIGELGQKEDPPVRFAYEALAWGAHLYRYAPCLACHSDLRDLSHPT